MSNTTQATLLGALRQCANALAYVAFNYDGSKLEDLDPRMVESTGVSETALIAERNARTLIAKLSAANAHPVQVDHIADVSKMVQLGQAALVADWLDINFAAKVYNALDEHAKSRTAADNVCDVLIAISTLPAPVEAQKVKQEPAARLKLSGGEYDYEFSIIASTVARLKAQYGANAELQLFAAPAPHTAQSEQKDASGPDIGDAECLAWIEKNLFERKWNGVIDSGSRYHWNIRGDYRHTVQRMSGFSFRNAIDAAKSSKADGKES